jgi:chemotaxis response regulator CheB
MTITLTREEAQQVLEGLENIAKSDWRKWEELADPKEFERWVKSRANHMAQTLRARLSAPEPEPKVEPEQSTTVAEREKVAKWMVKHGYATGHGDTIEDLLAQLDWQIKEKIND